MMKKERSSNIELLRIIAMLMIIVYHIWIHCIDVQLSNDTMYFIKPFFYKRLMVLDIISPFGQIANAIFILISGYFMLEKGKIDLAKIAKKLISQSLYATIALIFISIIVYKVYKSATISLMDINFFNNGSWFIGYYFAIMLSAYLFLNQFLIKLDQKKYLSYLVIIFAITQFCYTFGLIIEFSGSLLLFATGVMLYSLGGYIRKYNPFRNIKSTIIVLCIALLFCLVIISNYSYTSTNIDLYYLNNNGIFSQSILKFENNYFVPLAIAVCMFELFRRIKLKKNNVINLLGSSTLMIYLVHDNKFMYSVWKNVEWIKVLYDNPLNFIYKYIVWSLGIFEFGLILYLIYYILMILKKQSKL